MAFGISAAISKEIGSPPADPNPHRAENSHSAEKVLGKKPSTDGDAPQDQDSGIQTRALPETAIITDNLLLAKMLMYRLDAIGCPDLR